MILNLAKEQEKKEGKKKLGAISQSSQSLAAVHLICINAADTKTATHQLRFNILGMQETNYNLRLRNEEKKNSLNDGKSATKSRTRDRAEVRSECDCHKRRWLVGR